MKKRPKAIGQKIKAVSVLLARKTKETLGAFWQFLKRATERKRQLSLKIALAILILGTLLIIIYGVGIYKYHWMRYGTATMIKIIPYPAALVGNDFITVAEFQENKNYVLYFYQTTQSPPPLEEELNRQIIDQLIDQKVIQIALRQKGLSISQGEVENEYQKIIKQNKGEENVKKMLSDLYGLNIKSFKKLISQKLMIEKFKNECLVSVHAYHILKKVPEPQTEEGKKYVGDKTWELLNQLKSGVNFEELAMKHSDDEASKDKGGDLGWLQRGSLVNGQPMSAEFEKAVFSLSVGQFSEGPVWTEFGWHIFYVTEKRGKIDQSYQKWLAEEKSRTKILKFIGK